ncbi:unnamed protein product [Closterium sp. NIES-64]|nr:unnamed protein product [Closterium sp. NIES-64]
MSAPPLASFVSVPPNCHFPIQNLPYGVFRPSPGGSARVGVAIGEQVLDLSVVADAGLLGEVVKDTACFHQASLNAFMALGRPVWQRTRTALQRLLSADEPVLRDNKPLRAKAFHPQARVSMEMPAVVGDYTDFYASRHHATNVGRLFRGPGNELPKQWLHMPIAYHGRSSSVVVSGTPIMRPRGQLGLPACPATPLAPLFGPTQQLDFELEMAVLVGPGNERGERIPVERALDCCFGMVICNDWSARDIQRWEYVPLGPFLGKNFATTISPWVATTSALHSCICAHLPTPPPYHVHAATTISPWVGTMDAIRPSGPRYCIPRPYPPGSSQWMLFAPLTAPRPLSVIAFFLLPPCCITPVAVTAPHRTNYAAHPTDRPPTAQDPEPLPYLQEPNPTTFDIHLQASTAWGGKGERGERERRCVGSVYLVCIFLSMLPPVVITSSSPLPPVCLFSAIPSPQVSLAPSAPPSPAHPTTTSHPPTSPPSVPPATIMSNTADFPSSTPPPVPPCPHALLSPETLDSSPSTAGDASLSQRLPPVPVCRSNFKHLYWTVAQQVAHHTINGCPLRPGDLLASGTISGPAEGSEGCLLERTQAGKLTLELSPQGCRVVDCSSRASDRSLGPGTVRRRYLEDGDEVIMTATCQVVCTM